MLRSSGSVRPLRSGSSRWPNNTTIAIVPISSGMPATANEKNPNGGMHHVCYEVEDIHAAVAKMKAEGATITGTGEPRIGAHGKPVVFLHPKDFVGTLVELEQA